MLLIGGVVAAPPLDAGSALLVAVVLLACTAWSVHLALGCESPAQESVTRPRHGSRRTLRTAKLAVGATAALLVPSAGIGAAALTHHLAPGTGPLWGAALLAPVLVGTGLGALVHALLGGRAGYATLAVLATTLLDVVLPWAPPLGLLAGPTSATSLVACVLGSFAVAACALAVADRLDARR